VPDNHQKSDLPPGLGAFPLKPVSGYADKLIAPMVAKGGLFCPMYCEYWISSDALVVLIALQSLSDMA
jgi:hypothetical protein